MTYSARQERSDVTLPIVSVIIPTFNYGRFIGEAVESVVRNGFPLDCVEIVIVDDGSTDDTRERVQQHHWPVRYIRQENRGKAAATRRGFEASRGELIFNLDADDVFLPGKIEKVVHVFMTHAEVVHVGHAATMVGGGNGVKKVEQLPAAIAGRPIDGIALLAYLYSRNMLFGGGSTFAARSRTLKKLEIPDEIGMLIDEYLVINVCRSGSSYLLSAPLSEWREHGANYSRAENLQGREAGAALLASRRLLAARAAGEPYPPVVRTALRVKELVGRLALQERQGKKTAADVLQLWRTLGEGLWNRPVTALRMLLRYQVVRRSLPTSFLRWARVTSQRIRSMGSSSLE